jgi:hypothetical protein
MTLCGGGGGGGGGSGGGGDTLTQMTDLVELTSNQLFSHYSLQ